MQQYYFFKKYDYSYKQEYDDDNLSSITKSNIEEENLNKSDLSDKSNPSILENQQSEDECSQEEEKNINSFNLFPELNNERYRKEGIEQNDIFQQKNYSTGDTSKHGKKTIHKFYSLKENLRINNILINYKVQINQYDEKKLNTLLENSGVEELKVIKMKKINSRTCTANTTKEDNLNMLKLKNKEIFYYNKINHETQKSKNYFSSNKNQENNKNNIEIIFNIIKEKKMLGQYTSQLLAIENYLEMTYEDVIKEFYDSQKFRDFISKNETIKKNKFIEKAKGVKLEEKYGVINLIYSLLDIKRSPKDKNKKKKIE